MRTQQWRRRQLLRPQIAIEIEESQRCEVGARLFEREQHVVRDRGPLRRLELGRLVCEDLQCAAFVFGRRRESFAVEKCGEANRRAPMFFRPECGRRKLIVRVPRWREPRNPAMV